MKTKVPLAITFITGTIIIITFFIPHKPFGDLEQRFLVWYAIVWGFTLILGLKSLVEYHLKKIYQRRKGYGYSFVLLAGLIVSITTGIISWIRFGNPMETQSSFMYLYKHFVIPLQSTMFALLDFFIASASYRAFRAHNFAATLLLLSAVMVMLGRVPLGQWIWNGIVSIVNPHLKGMPVLAKVAEWIMNVPQTAAKRGIFIGTYLGGVAMSMRVILGLERTYLK